MADPLVDKFKTYNIVVYSDGVEKWNIKRWFSGEVVR